MKKECLFIYLIALVASMIACKKATEPIASLNNTLKEFDSCNCTIINIKQSDSEYIKATINGVPMCFDQQPNLGDTFPNMMPHGQIIRPTGNTYYDNLYMIRNAKNTNWQLAMFFENTHALTKKYPYQLPRENPEVCEIGGIQLNYLYNKNKSYSASFWASGMKMTATSFNNQYFEGTFSGNLGGVTITNGKFRIRIIVYEKNLVIQ